MRKLSTLVLLVLLVSVMLVPMGAQAAPDDEACWGQATRVFAQTADMGQHASQEPTPRLGLRNLARALYESGALPDDTMQSLGTFVADALGLNIDACQ
jgi:hypothetical protein